MCSSVFIVEDIESRQADVRDFFLTESNYRCRAYRGSRGLIAVIHCHESKLAAVHAAIRIGRVECGLNTELHVLAEFLGGTSEWRRNPKPNFAVGYAANTVDAVLSAERIGG